MKSKRQIFIFSILKTFTEIFFLTFSLLFSSLQALAQLHDDFQDNELTQNPLWTGSLSHFTVEDGILKLSAPAVSASSYLSTQNMFSAGAEWRCSVEMQFNPSSSNFCRVYLTSDSEDLNGDLNGYFVLIGGSSDEISLYRQSGSVKTKIIDGADKRVDQEQLSVRLNVTRTTDGKWELFSTLNGVTIKEGSTMDAIHLASGFAGLQCVYTSTRSDKFFFDDFVITELPDTQAPRVSKLSVSAEQTLEILFSEEVAVESATALMNYEVNGGIGQPSIAAVSTDNKLVVLEFAKAFTAAHTYHLVIDGVADRSANLLTDTLEFSYIPAVVPVFKDVVISELFPDPSPSVGLPEAEFVEVYNRSDKTFVLKDWKLTDGNSTATIGSNVLLSPRGYVVLTSVSNAEKFSVYSPVVGISNFPSLNNSQDAIVLKDTQGHTVDSVSYSDSWYRNASKRDGGYTLELIDPDNLCATSDNWIASEDDDGGTPGKLNSVYAEKPDLTGPEVLHAFAIYPDTIRLLFSEKMRKDLSSIDHYSLNVDLAFTTAYSDAALTEVSLITNKAFTPGQILILTCRDLFDCAGNALQSGFETLKIFLPEEPDSLDVLISEVLFNPRTNGVDFVELVNVSNKLIDLRDWSIANDDSGQIKNPKPISTTRLFLQPGEFAAFSADPDVLMTEYPQAPPEKNHRADLPPLNNDQGSVILLAPDHRPMDIMSYTDDMHSAFLKSKEGVSLERISYDVPGHAANNWKSASSILGFATPGAANSNFQPESLSGEEVRVVPEIFIPENGHPDYALIQYGFNHGGYICNVHVFDSRGRVIKAIAENELLGATGFLRWEGDRDDGTRAAIGPYLIKFEVFNAAGSLKTLLRRVVIAGKF